MVYVVGSRWAVPHKSSRGGQGWVACQGEAEEGGTQVGEPQPKHQQADRQGQEHRDSHHTSYELF
jgi:hypothetical protein